jgi:hypothetical protein
MDYCGWEKEAKKGIDLGGHQFAFTYCKRYKKAGYLLGVTTHAISV